MGFWVRLVGFWVRLVGFWVRLPSAPAAVPRTLLQGLGPTSRTFTAVLMACNVAGQLDAAIDVWQRMLAAGLEPTTASYNAMISAYSKSDRVTEALALLKVGVAGQAQPPTISSRSSPQRTLSCLAGRPVLVGGRGWPWRPVLGIRLHREGLQAGMQHACNVAAGGRTACRRCVGEASPTAWRPSTRCWPLRSDKGMLSWRWSCCISWPPTPPTA